MATKSAFSKTSLEASNRAVELDSPADEPSLGEVSSLMKTELSGFIAARVELASIEAKEAGEFVARKGIQGIILGIALFFFWSLILAGLTGVLAPMADEWLAGKVHWLPGREAVLFALDVPHGIVAFIFLIARGCGFIPVFSSLTSISSVV